MKAACVSAVLASFTAIARQGVQKLEKTPPFIVDVYIKGGGSNPIFSGTMGMPVDDWNTVDMELDTDDPYNAITIDCDAIAAIRMTKRHGRAA